MVVKRHLPYHLSVAYWPYISYVEDVCSSEGGDGISGWHLAVKLSQKCWRSYFWLKLECLIPMQRPGNASKSLRNQTYGCVLFSKYKTSTSNNCISMLYCLWLEYPWGILDTSAVQIPLPHLIKHILLAHVVYPEKHLQSGSLIKLSIA